MEAKIKSLEERIKELEARLEESKKTEDMWYNQFTATKEKFDAFKSAVKSVVVLVDDNQ